MKKLFAFLFAVLLVFGSLAIPAAAVTIPSRPGNQYVLDSAGVLSSEAEQSIISINQTLFNQTGAEIVVVAVDFISGDDIADYANELFDQWGIGSSQRNNGLLLVLAIAEEDYYALPGYGINNLFSGQVLKGMLQDELEEDFDAENYEAGVLKFVNSANAKLTDYYKTHTDEYSNQEAAFETGGARQNIVSRLLNLLKPVIWLIVVVLVLVILFGSFSRGGRGGGFGGGGYGGRGGFWQGMFLGNMLGGRRRGRWGPPGGGFGGFPGGGRSGGFGGFTGGGRSGGGGAGRGGFGGGGFSGGGRSGGGGVGRR